MLLYIKIQMQQIYHTTEGTRSLLCHSGMQLILITLQRYQLTFHRFQFCLVEIQLAN
jgi:hypothetical protein